jgi:hypothetical protein
LTSGRGLLASSLFLFQESENQKQILEKALKDSLHGTKRIAHSSKTSFRWQEYLQGQRGHSTPELSQKTGSCNHYYCRLQNTDGRAHLLQSFADCTFDSSRLQKAQASARSNSVGGSLFPIRYTMSVRVSFAANIGTFILFPPGSSTAYRAGVAAPWQRVPAGSREERERERSNPNTIFCIGNQTTLDPNPRKRPKKQSATPKRMESYKQDCKVVNTRFATL